MKEYIDTLKKQIAENLPNLDGSESVLAFLYKAYSEVNRMDDARIKADFNTLYQTMNGMSLREMDQILDPVCTLCRDYERSGFIHGVKIGIGLLQKLENTERCIVSLIFIDCTKETSCDIMRINESSPKWSLYHEYPSVHTR